MKSKTVHELASAPFISFMIGGDTDVSMKECQIIYARIIRMGKPANILIGHIEVQHASAQGKCSRKLNKKIMESTVINITD